MGFQDYDSTVSLQVDRGGREPATRAFLFFVLQSDQLALVGARHCMDGAARVTLGRAPARTFSRLEPGTLALGVPDRSISTSHALLRREGERWLVSDTGSKNGTLLNGAPLIQETPLASGDWLELGHAFFLFQSLVATAAEPRSIDGRAIASPLPGFPTLNPELAEELGKLELAARSKIPVLLGGESGTGKEVVASAVHRLSQRPGLFEPVNCGALASNLIESELFGYRKGAFSGANEDRAGLIRTADRGTLFLDEIGDLPLPAQATLLRVLQESEVTPVGGTRPVAIDLRVVSATHRDLAALADAGQFRADLLARISGFALRLPPLRERRMDLGFLIPALLQRHLPDQPLPGLTAEAARALLRYPWPLNVRELEKCLMTAAVLSRGGTIELGHLPAAVRAAKAGEFPAPQPARVLSHEDQQLRARLVALFEKHGGNLSAVAAELGKARNQIQRWVKRFGIDLDQLRR